MEHVRTPAKPDPSRSARRPHIHIPIHGLHPNGTGFATLGVADYLQSSGRYDVSILSYSGHRRTQPRSDLAVHAPSLTGLRYLPGPARQMYKRWRRTSAVARSINAADLVMVPDDWGPTLSDPISIAAQSSTPVCCVVHIDLESKFTSPEFPGGWTKEQTLEQYRRVDRIICVSEGIRDGLIRDLPEKADDILAIQNGIDLARLDRLAAEPLPDGTVLPDIPYFVGVARLVYAKGFDLLIEAHARVLARGGARHAVVLVGEGEMQGELEAQARSLGVEDTVRFLGFATNPFPVMARAVALVSASRYEGWSLTMSEATALGVPVIATDCPHGPTEVLHGGRYGALIAMDDPEALAAAMNAHLADPEPLREKATASFADRDRLSDERAHRKYESIFRSLLDGPPARLS